MSLKSVTTRPQLQRPNVVDVNTARKSSTHAAGVKKLIAGHTKATPKPLAGK